MNAPLPKAPINWIAIFALVFLPIVAVIAIPWYAYHHDFSLAAWISMFVLLGVSSLGITAGYHRLWAHRAYRSYASFKNSFDDYGDFCRSEQYFVLGFRSPYPSPPC